MVPVVTDTPTNHRSVPQRVKMKWNIEVCHNIELTQLQGKTKRITKSVSFLTILFLSLSLVTILPTPKLADRFLQLKLDDMEYTRTVFSPYSHEQYWNYWIHNVDLTKVEHSYFPGSVVLQYLAANLSSHHGDGHPPPMEHLLFHNDLPLLFSKHEQILYCCVVILSSIGILYVLGVKIWEKY